VSDRKSKRHEIEVAVQLMLDGLPSLRRMTIEVNDEGEISVDYTTCEVKVVEDAWSLQIAPKVRK